MEHGGLGFKDIRAFNDALLAKQLWRLLTQPNLLMSEVLKARYYPTRGLLNAEAQSNDSFLWRNWIETKETLRQGLRYQIGDGKSIKIWESPWLKCSPGFKSTTRKAETCDLTWVGIDPS